MTTDGLLALLEQKRTLYLTCERLTEALCTAPAEELSGLIEQRGLHLAEAEKLDSAIRALCASDTPLRDVLNHNCPRDGLGHALGELYDASQAVKAVASRILQCEDMARARLELERDRAAEGLRTVEANRSGVADRYLKSVETGLSSPFPPAPPKNF